MSRLSLLQRASAVLRQGSLLIVVCVLLLGLVGTLLQTAPVGAVGPADIPTQLPPPPTEIPATEVPPTQVPPTEVPPTEGPEPRQEPSPTAQPRPTEVPPTEQPRPNRPPRRDDDPTPTPSATATAMPPPATATPAPHTNVRVNKNVNPSSAQRGERVVYTLLVENTGAAQAMDLVLTDLVPGALEVIDLRSGKGDIVVSGQQVTAYPVTLAPGERASYQITVLVRSDAAGSVFNRATITTSTPGDDPTDNTSTVELLILPPPTAAPPVAAPPRLPPRLPPTSDPTDGGLVWQLLPWALLAVAVVGVGGLLAWSIASTRSLTESLITFMAPRALARTSGQPAVEASAPERTAPPVAAAPHSTVRPARGEAPSSVAAPPLGAPFDPPPAAGPLPPPAALDRESVLRRRNQEGV